MASKKQHKPKLGKVEPADAEASGNAAERFPFERYQRVCSAFDDLLDAHGSAGELGMVAARVIDGLARAFAVPGHMPEWAEEFVHGAGGALHGRNLSSDERHARAVRLVEEYAARYQDEVDPQKRTHIAHWLGGALFARIDERWFPRDPDGERIYLTERIEELLERYDANPAGKRGKLGAAGILAELNRGVGAQGLPGRDDDERVEANRQVIEKAKKRERERHGTD